MITARIDGAAMEDIDALYAALVAELALPDHTGHNLDALWDVLTRDLEGPAAIVVIDAGVMRERLGAAADKVLDLLTEVVAERDDLSLSLV